LGLCSVVTGVGLACCGCSQGMGEKDSLHPSTGLLGCLARVLLLELLLVLLGCWGHLPVGLLQWVLSLRRLGLLLW